LIIDHKTNEAREAVSVYCRAAGIRYGTSGKQLEQAANYNLSYFLGDFKGLEKAARADSSALGRSQLYIALIEQNRPDEAERLIPLNDPSMTQSFAG
jgi:hypothetical protein